MPREQNAGRSYKIKTDNNCSKCVKRLNYLRTTLTNQGCINEVNNRLNRGKACYQLCI